MLKKNRSRFFNNELVKYKNYNNYYYLQLLNRLTSLNINLLTIYYSLYGLYYRSPYLGARKRN
jgi:hypothetical protein